VNIELLLFAFLAAAGVTTGILMITRRNPVMSAICLIGNFFCLAGLYLLLRAQLLAVMQIIVYTGAIMVLVIFVIMLLNLDDERSLRARLNLWSTTGIALAAGLLVEFGVLFGLRAAPDLDRAPSAMAGRLGTVEEIGKALFGRFLLPFELTSVLLLAAIVGAVLLAKRRI
jgi:NADH-quinone oxidoreductase subunit J